jgi:hypothetical protein
MKTSTAKKQGPNGVPCQVVTSFLNELEPLNSCLLELAILTASGDEPPTPALLSLLSDLYGKVTNRFLEEARRAKLPLVEEGGVA